MRKLNTKRAVPLDAVPERRTKRFPPRFRPVGRFCELSFRYQSSPTGREGEISRPLDHMRQIPLIHPARLTVTSNFDIYIQQCSSYFLYVERYSVSWARAVTITHAPLLNTHFRVQSLVLFHEVRAGSYWNLRMRVS